MLGPFFCIIKWHLCKKENKFVFISTHTWWHVICFKAHLCPSFCCKEWKNGVDKKEKKLYNRNGGEDAAE